MVRRGPKSLNDGWWYLATDDQRMEQVLGAIECGMTQAQLSMNVGATSSRAISNWCRAQGVHWGLRNDGRSGRFYQGKRNRARTYYRGEASEEARLIEEGFRLLGDAAE